MKTIPLEKLMKDGIALHKGDTLMRNTFHRRCSLDNPQWEGKAGLDWFNKLGGSTVHNPFKDYSLISFAERKNETGKQPVPDWVGVDVKREEEDGTFLVLADELSWKLEWNCIESWKPAFDSLYNHYNKASESDSKTSKAESDTMNHVSEENTSDYQYLWNEKDENKAGKMILSIISSLHWSADSIPYELVDTKETDCD